MYRTATHFQGGVTSSTEVDNLCKIYCRKCSVKTTLLSEKQSHVTYKLADKHCTWLYISDFVLILLTLLEKELPER